MYGVHKVQMPLPGPCISAGKLVGNYSATNVGPTQKDRPLMGPEPGMTVLVRANGNLLDWTGLDVLALNPAHCCLDMGRGMAIR
jgi:hypothetical protein